MMVILSWLRRVFLGSGARVEVVRREEVVGLDLDLDLESSVGVGGLLVGRRIAFVRAVRFGRVNVGCRVRPLIALVLVLVFGDGDDGEDEDEDEDGEEVEGWVM